MESMEVRVYFSQHGKTGLWRAESPDLRGLLVFDRDAEVLREELPSLVTALLEEEGKRVYSVCMSESLARS